MYKSNLQEWCQQKQWELPRYTSMKDGPDHNPRFKASVFLNGTSFHSSTSCKSCKEAQNDAAKSAFLHFTSASSSSLAATLNPSQEVMSIGFYKNLLQELTQREGLSAPEYETMKCGVPHRPTFFSSVQVEGEVFHGRTGKSKKEAELYVAKVAYTTLTQRLQGNGSVFSSLLKSMSNSDLANAVENGEHDEESKQEVLANSQTSLPDTSSHSSKSVPVSPKEVSSNFATAVEYEEEDAEEVKSGEKVSPKEGSLYSTSTHLDISALSISDSNVKKEEPGLRSYLLNNRFRVYSCFPDIAFPKGITVLPISEDKWVAVSLEFPNEKDD